MVLKWLSDSGHVQVIGEVVPAHLDHPTGGGYGSGSRSRNRRAFHRKALARDGSNMDLHDPGGLSYDQLDPVVAEAAEIPALRVEGVASVPAPSPLGIRDERLARSGSEGHLFGVSERLDRGVDTLAFADPGAQQELELTDVIVDLHVDKYPLV